MVHRVALRGREGRPGREVGRQVQHEPDQLLELREPAVDALDLPAHGHDAPHAVEGRVRRLHVQLQARLGRLDAVDRQHEGLQQRAFGVRPAEPHHAVHGGALGRGALDRAGPDVHGGRAVHLADLLGPEVRLHREALFEELEGQGHGRDELAFRLRGVGFLVGGEEDVGEVAEPFQVQARHHLAELVEQLLCRLLVQGVEDRAGEGSDGLHRVAHVRRAVLGVPLPAVFDRGAVDREEGFPLRGPAGGQAGAEAGHDDVVVEDHGFVGFVEAVAGFGEEAGHVRTRELPPVVEIGAAGGEPAGCHGPE